MDLGLEDFDLFEEVAPGAHAAMVDSLIAHVAAAHGASNEVKAMWALRALWVMQDRPWPRALEMYLVYYLQFGDAATFLKHKNIFRMLSGLVLKKISIKCDRWHRLPLVGLLMNSHTCHLSISLRPFGFSGEHWTLQDLKRLCDDVAREGKTSLLSLEIDSRREPEGSNPGLHSTQLGSLLLELRALTSLHLECDFKTDEIDLLVSILASKNSHIRSLGLPNLSSKSLSTIADHWPQLRSLHARYSKFDSSHLEAVLPRLKNLEKLDFNGDLSAVMMAVARTHDSASPPYKLINRFSRPSIGPVSSGDMINLFTAFPAIYGVAVLETDIPAVCAGLEGREHIRITDLKVTLTSSNPRALEPLLARVGNHLIMLHASAAHGRMDLNMIGHYCQKLKDLTIYAGQVISSDDFNVTEAHFANLEKWRVCHFAADDENSPAHLPVALVFRLLASRTLETVYCGGVPITQEVVAALAEGRERGALLSLNDLTVCYEPNLDVDGLAALAIHAPSLRFLTLLGDEMYVYEDGEDKGVCEIRDKLQLFMQVCGLPVDVDIDY